MKREKKAEKSKLKCRLNCSKGQIYHCGEMDPNEPKPCKEKGGRFTRKILQIILIVLYYGGLIVLTKYGLVPTLIGIGMSVCNVFIFAIERKSQW